MEILNNRHMQFLAGIAFLIALIALAVWYAFPRHVAVQLQKAAAQESATSTTGAVAPVSAVLRSETSPVVVIGGQRVSVTLALTESEQARGLGGRSGLGDHEGMLFVFPGNDEHLFWMKDMNFSIDMIWFSADGTVIYIQPNVAPDTYPEAFGPHEASRFVLEVPANFAAQHGIKVGDRAILPQ